MPNMNTHSNRPSSKTPKSDTVLPSFMLNGEAGLAQVAGSEATDTTAPMPSEQVGSEATDVAASTGLGLGDNAPTTLPPGGDILQFQIWDCTDISSWTKFDRMLRVGTQQEVMAMVLDATVEEVQQLKDSDEYRKFLAMRKSVRQKHLDDIEDKQISSEKKAWTTLDKALEHHDDIDTAVSTIKLAQSVPRRIFGGNREGLGMHAAASVNQLQSVRITSEVAEVIESGNLTARVSPPTDNIIDVPTVESAEQILGVSREQIQQEETAVDTAKTSTQAAMERINGLFKAKPNS